MTPTSPPHLRPLSALPAALRIGASLLVGLALSALVPRNAAAQPELPPMSDADRDAAVSRAESVARCLRTQSEAMERVMHLIEDSRRQMSSQDARLRRDAQAAVEALLVRAEAAREAVTRCVNGAPIGTPEAAVEERDGPVDRAAERMGQQGGSLRTVEENSRLSAAVLVVRAEQVDGQGRVAPASLRTGVRRIGGRLQACYESFVDRASSRSGRLSLVFTILASGNVHNVTVESPTLGDEVFRGCVQRAGERIHADGGATDGRATFSYTLQFGS